MKNNKHFFARTLMTAALALFGATGCVVDQQEQRSVMQQQREDSIIMEENMRRIRARLDAIESDMQRLAQQINASSTDLSRANQSQIAGFNATLDELQKRIRAVDAARESDKKEIVDSLSKKISAVLASQPSRSSSTSTQKRSVSNEGYEHEVQPGETLSAIAKAYGVSSADIIQANGLKSADVLRVGQKLFVPAR
jgi:LysM repeat protein